MERLLEMRYEIAWMVQGWNQAATHDVEMTMVYDNRIKDDADRYPKLFKFDGLVGMIDFEGDSPYVQWGGMGVHLESIGGYELRKAIKNQTGY